MSVYFMGRRAPAKWATEMHDIRETIITGRVIIIIIRVRRSLGIQASDNWLPDVPTTWPAL